MLSYGFTLMGVGTAVFACYALAPTDRWGAVLIGGSIGMVFGGLRLVVDEFLKKGERN